MYNIKTDNSGQVSTELILLLAGMIIIVLVALTLYKNYVIDFDDEIRNNELKDLIEKIDSLNSKIK